MSRIKSRHNFWATTIALGAIMLFHANSAIATSMPPVPEDSGTTIGFKHREAQAAKSAGTKSPEQSGKPAENSQKARAHQEDAKSAAEKRNPAGSKVVAKAPKYRISYSTTCIAITSGKGSCITFDEAPCADDDPLTVRTVRTLGGKLVARDSYCSREPPPDLPVGSTENPAAVERAIEMQRVIEVTPADFQSFPIHASKVISQPKSFSLRNGNAHMYAEPNPQTFDVDIYDEPVRIRATPQSYIWNYGDGQSKRTRNPGKPMPNHTFDQPTDTSHVYTETGDFSIRLSTVFRGEYSVNGGPWRPVMGTASVPSEPMPMSVWRTKKLLVDQNCSEDPDGPACDSPFLKDQEPSK